MRAYEIKRHWDMSTHTHIKVSSCLLGNMTCGWDGLMALGNPDVWNLFFEIICQLLT